MKTIDRFTIDHHQVDAPQLHNDLNKMVARVNENFGKHETLITTQNTTIAAQAALIADLQARLTAAGF